LVGLIAIQYKDAGITEEPFFAFVNSMPYMFYLIGSILLVFLIALIGKDFGPMRKAEERAIKEGKLIGDKKIQSALSHRPMRAFRSQKKKIAR